MVNRIAEKVTVAFLCDSIGGNGNTTKSTRKRELPLHLVPQTQTLPDTKEEKIGKEGRGDVFLEHGQSTVEREQSADHDTNKRFGCLPDYDFI